MLFLESNSTSTNPKPTLGFENVHNSLSQTLILYLVVSHRNMKNLVHVVRPSDHAGTEKQSLSFYLCLKNTLVFPPAPPPELEKAAIPSHSHFEGE